MLLYKTYFFGIFANCGLDYYASEPFRQVAIFSNKNDVISNFKCSIEMCRLRNSPLDVLRGKRYNKNVAIMFASFIQQTGRKYHFCPFEKCRKAVLKLSQHLIQVHQGIEKAQRLEMCKMAIIAKGRGARKPRHKPTGKKSTVIS